jgi:hypothetical protein
MIATKFIYFFVAMMLITPSGYSYPGLNKEYSDKKDEIVQGHVVLTVSESKRLIGKAIAQSSFVKDALKEGMVIITRGSTTTYVAEEILNKTIPHGAFLTGRTQPATEKNRLETEPNIGEIVLIKGEWRKDLSLADAVKDLKPGDVVIKGANALDYKNKLSAGLIGAPNSGTTGTIIPYITGSKAKLLIPVGLEKEIGADLIDVVRKMQEPLKSLHNVPSMYLYTGEIITEIESLKILADVSATHIASGGIQGAEGAVMLLLRGPEENVKNALEIIKGIQGEPRFPR